MDSTTKAPFWTTKKLSEMSKSEWESLCDCCGRCCLAKVENARGTIHHTRVACRLMNTETGMCSAYARRTQRVHDCMRLTWRNVGRIRYLPSTCAYRLLSEGKPLPPWHPLISGTKQSVNTAGISVAGKVILESKGIDLDKHRITWIPASRKKRRAK